MTDEDKLFDNFIQTCDLKSFIANSKKRFKQNKEIEKANSTYFEREDKKKKIKEIKAQFKDDFEKIRVSEDVLDWHTLIEDYIKSKNDLTEYEKRECISKADKLFSENDSDEIESLYFEIQIPYDKRGVEWYKTQIIATLNNYSDEIITILSEIKTYHQADIVLSFIEGSMWLNKLKNKPKIKNTYAAKYRRKKGLQPLVHKVEMKRNKITLQKQLQEIGTGVGRSRTLSTILHYI